MRKSEIREIFRKYPELASMGPHFFKCGNGRNWVGIDQHPEAASMGPHFFKCGNYLVKIQYMSHLLFASMGPHFFKCGNFDELFMNGNTPVSFNGAALFQVRKSQIRHEMDGFMFGFNGAALFQVRKCQIY